tara:strand:- start:222 stop:1352 length:1131 start_codon:yes stop_codon:yes gene_type:complete
MKYCLKCLQPDTRPNSKFDEAGICPACQYFEEVRTIDWDERYLILLDLVREHRGKSDGGFDCIVGVSGGKDSTRQALYVRDKLKMNPLLVCLSYPPEQITHTGTHNISNLIELGFDVLISAPASNNWKELMRAGFLRFCNWCKSTELALFSAVPQMAIRYNIPIIFWGENPGLQLGDQNTLGKTGYDGNNLRHMNTLQGGELDWIFDTVNDRSLLIPYCYPDPVEFEQCNLQIVYLGWFLKDWSLVNNAMHSVTSGLGIRSDSVVNTGDFYGVTSLDEDWVTLNQMIKYYKYGFGRMTEYVNEEIRLNRISRESAIRLVEKHDGVCAFEYIESFCKYIGVSTEQFWDTVRASVNAELFTINDNGKICPNFTVGSGL